LKDQYGDLARHFNTFPVRPVSAVIPVDYFIPGCPIVSDEFVRVVQELLAGKVPYQPSNPVCAECKVAQNVCVYDKGQTCLGPVTRGGCRATCVTGGAICWGCRGLIDEPNIPAQKEIMKNAGLDPDEIERRFNLFNQYHEAVWR
jgi:sulfhydrogenase subunit delta